MKKLLLAASIAAVSAGTVADNKVPANYGYLGVHLSQLYFGTTPLGDYDAGMMPGAQVGLRFKDQWSVQGWWGEADMDRSVGGPTDKFTHYFASVRHHYQDINWSGFEPYTGASIGQLQIEGNEETLAGVELGVQRALGSAFVLDVGVRPNYVFDNERWDGELYAGLNFVFGGTGSGSSKVAEQPEEVVAPVEELPVENAEPMVVEVVDSDGDGVPDPLDKCASTSAGSKVDESGCNVILLEDIKEALYVQFVVGGASVSEDSLEDIGRIATRMLEFPDVQLVLEGHTDSSGGADLNLRLSQQRAEAVKQVLVERFKIESGRIYAVGRGEDAPIASNDSAEGRAKNRRVETILKAQKAVTQ